LYRQEVISVRVVGCHGLKPMEVEMVLNTTEETGAIVTVKNKEHVSARKERLLIVG
jgi:transketolase C-terminal domain/subunit